MPETNGGITNTQSGPLDALMGPYSTTAAACTAIPNNVIDGKSFRDGKSVLIGTGGSYIEYWWKGGYDDSNLVPVLSDAIRPQDLTTSVGVNLFDKTVGTPGFYVASNGALVANASCRISAIIPIDATKGTLFISGVNTNAGNKFYQFLNSGGTVLSFGAVSTQPATGLPIPATATGFRFTVQWVGEAATVLDTVMLNYGSAAVPYQAYQMKVNKINGNPLDVSELFQAIIQSINASPYGIINKQYLTDQGIVPPDTGNDVSTNVFNKSNILQPDKLINTNGGLSAATGYQTQEITLRTGVTNYTISGITANLGNKGARFLDSTGALITESAYLLSARTQTNGAFVLTVPSGAVKLQVTVKASAEASTIMDTVMINEGNTALAYEAYYSYPRVTGFGGKLVRASSILDGITVSNLLLKSVGATNQAIINKQWVLDQLFLKSADVFYFKNLFNPAAVINGSYIGTTGTLQSDANSAISAWMPVSGSAIYVSGRTSNAGARFRNSSGTVLPPVDASGNALGYLSGPQNGIYYVPAGATDVQLTVKFTGTGAYDQLQVELGNVKTDYVAYGSGSIKTNLLPSQTATTTVKKTFTVIISGQDIYVSAAFNATYDIVVKMSTSNFANGVMNFVLAKLINKGSDIVSDNGQQLPGASNDDACPVNFNTGYLGANHGNGANLQITANGHGKTLADVGSVWTDTAGVKWTLLQVVDANNLYMMSENTNTTGGWTFKLNPGTTLTYLSGAANTGTITVGSYTSVQLRPSNKNLVQKLVADNVVISGNGTYTCDTFDIVETYDIIDTPDMVAKLAANRPSGGYTVQPDFRNGDAIISLKNTFNFKKTCTVVVLSDFIVRKDIIFGPGNYYGVTQSAYVLPAWATSFKRYLPSALPISDGSRTWDFRTRESILTAYATDLHLSSAYWDGGRPVNRAVDLVSNGSTLNINYNIGYLPLGVGADRTGNVNEGWYLAASRKHYPHAIDSKIADSNSKVAAGTVKQGVAYRGWSELPSGRTNYFAVHMAGSNYIFIDWHITGTDVITFNDDLIGKPFTVVEKSNNVSVLGSMITGNLEFIITANTPQYGYIVLKV